MGEEVNDLLLAHLLSWQEKLWVLGGGGCLLELGPRTKQCVWGQKLRG